MSTKEKNMRGLSDSEVDDLRAQYGWNELPRGTKTSIFAVFFRQFTSFLVVILIIAAVIAFALNEQIDALAISLVVALNGVLGFVQEWRAETALEALRNMLSPQAMVVRNGHEKLIPTRELVPGDLIIVAAGDKIPADASLRAAVQLRVDESTLTGESVPVEKDPKDPEARIFNGTSVVAGHAEAVVTEIGAMTSFGHIASLTVSVGTKKTHLQTQLARLARQLGFAALFIAALILGLGIWLGRPAIEMFMTGLSLAVAMVPEGLPAVVTVTLALGAAAMARQKALARRLQAVETLGAASVICTDKTGTLTENKMTATQIWTPELIYTVTGTGYDPTGHIEADGQRLRAADDFALKQLLETALFCNHARLHRAKDHWDMFGEPTEGALVTLAYKGWVELPKTANILHEIPFSSERKRMSILLRQEDQTDLHSKGAPEQILEISSHVLRGEHISSLTTESKTEILAAYKDMAAQGLRVLALARRSEPDHNFEESEMTFLGLVGLIDPPRPEVSDAVRAAMTAGIKLMMITGDSPVTAKAVADQIGLKADMAVTGDEVETMTEKELLEALNPHALFARTKPVHKMRIIAALQKDNQIVAMTGDGVNDAPALKQADIGVSMGIRGTDVAKDASDLVLLDDNFATIVRAIQEGRRQFDNVRKFVRYLLSSNAGEVIAILANILIGGPLIFLATQILWMNLVTDGLTAVALGLEKAETDQMRVPPRRKDEGILGLNSVLLIATFGLYTGGASLWIFFELLPQGEHIARTAAFTAMVVFEKLSVFAFRSLKQPCWRIGLFSNPLLLLALTVTLSAQVAAVYWQPLQTLLHTVPLGADEWKMILLFSLPIIILPESIKTILFWFRPQPTQK